MTTKFKVGDHVRTNDGRTGFVWDYLPGSVDPYGVRLVGNSVTLWFSDDALTAIDAAPTAPVPPPTVQIDEHNIVISKIVSVKLHDASGHHKLGNYQVIIYTVDGDHISFEPGNLQAAAFYEWWTSNTVMRFVPDDTEADNG